MDKLKQEHAEKRIGGFIMSADKSPIKSKGPCGLSLIETMISLSLFLLMLLAAFQVFSASQVHFISLKNEQEIDTAASAALDKMKMDIQRSGQKLAEPASLGLLKPLAKIESSLCLLNAEQYIPLEDSIFSGQTSIPLSETAEIKTGNEICVFDGKKGEVKTVASTSETFIQISSPLTHSYSSDTTFIILLRKITFYLDERQDILRRKVNSSPAQPLCEEIGAFDCSYDPFTNLVKVILELKAEPEENHALLIFPKNAALAAKR